ncbi:MULTISPECIES: septum site-determining protein MinD [Aminobacterium]|uniref:Septum site-determining protein MinD n=1 Tax=Aminobacterium colombiense (strain DSM 12261 / ALA-1) TaxID=572547 RepID=D5EDV9_AMICL|nr:MULTISPECIES: septum site-determining protein MinD [Aminobacterium]MDD2379028.1 septum site-determining protein MinD [Aminobacterium colombiense]ADE56741.1 septum site-determining protein MinD [Aminobacterium colombiense DSM 12261]MDD3767289.1 septum site-determining protein MinD [Aminobacterium colombiense]MDD4265318.1 septum site-determining protein MinD [Aminobacterium colombiense]MDD4586028.1 septum site-determining protein MinD [Aminobacterium colombiense]
MEPRVIVVTSGKGGVGKTTTTANVSFALAKAGYKVVAIDADIGLRNLDVVMGLENRVVYNFIDVIEGTCRLPQALIRDKRVDNLFLLPAAQTRTKDAVSPDQMVELCEMLKKEGFDFILLDSPAGIEGGFKNAAAGATEALVVTTPEIPSVRDADRIIGLLESMEKKPIRLVINRVKPSMVKEGEMLDVQDVLDVLAIELIGIVPDDDSVVKSANRGEPLTSGDTSLASMAFSNIADRLLGKEVAFLNLDSQRGSGFFSGIKKLLGF